MKSAFIFPGQGSQKIGMGKELAKAYPEARAVFESVDEALDQNLSRLVWEGDLKELTLTENAQPAIMANSMAILVALKTEGFELSSIDFVAGHSLGEYTAFCAADAITIADTAKLLKIRGRAMQVCDNEGKGSMAAILGLTFDEVQKIVDEASTSTSCQIANDNDPAQIVISGYKDAVERAMDFAKIKGAKRALALNVSAPFHSKLMDPAAEVMREALSSIRISKPMIPVVMNTQAKDIADPVLIKKCLIDQVAGMVRWRESINYMNVQGVNKFYELGEGKSLSGMVKRTVNEVQTISVSAPEEIISTMEKIKDDATQK